MIFPEQFLWTAENVGKPQDEKKNGGGALEIRKISAMDVRRKKKKKVSQS